MSGFGILGTVVAGTVALAIGLPLALAGGAIVLAFGGVALAAALAGGVLWFVFRFAFAIFGVLAWLLAGGVALAIAAAIASHLLPVLFIGFCVWLVMRANRPAAPSSRAIAA